MKTELEKFLQVRVIGVDEKLSNIVACITPRVEEKFTNLEIEAEKKQEFRMVLYKKDNFIVGWFKSIKLFVEKLKIAKHSKELGYVKIDNK